MLLRRLEGNYSQPYNAGPVPAFSEMRPGGLQPHPADDDLSRSQAFLAKLQAMDLPDSPPPEAEPTQQRQPAGGMQQNLGSRPQDIHFGGPHFDRGQPTGAPPSSALQNGHVGETQHEEMADDIAAALAHSRRRASQIPDFEPGEPEVTHFQQDFTGPASTFHSETTIVSSTAPSPPLDSLRREGGMGMDGGGVPGPTVRTGSPIARGMAPPPQTAPFSAVPAQGSPRGSPSGRPASRITPGGPGSPRIASPVARVSIPPAAFTRDTHFGSAAPQQPPSSQGGGFSDSAFDAPPQSRSPAGFESSFDRAPIGTGAASPAASPARPSAFTAADSSDEEDDAALFGGLMGPLSKRPPATSQAPSTAPPAAKPVSQPPSTFGSSFDDAFGVDSGFGAPSKAPDNVSSGFDSSFDNAFGGDAGFGSSAFSTQKATPTIASPKVLQSI